MALGENDRLRFGRMGIEFARSVENPELISDAQLLIAARIHYNTDLAPLTESERKDALGLIVEACRQRITSMQRKTIQVRPSKR